MSGLTRKRVLVTRPRHQSATLCDALRSRGAEPLEFPVIEIESLVESSDVDRALRGLDNYAWVGFTSANGARIAVPRWRELHDRAWPSDVRVAAVGSATAAVLRDLDVPVHAVPNDFQGAALPGVMDDVSGRAVLLLRADIADRGLADALRKLGAVVDDVAVYRTVASTPDDRHIAAAKNGVDAVTFTSPSTVNSFLDVAQKVRMPVNELVVASIGPVTTTAAQEAGLSVHVEADPHTIGGLVDGLESYWNEEGSRRAHARSRPRTATR